MTDVEAMRLTGDMDSVRATAVASSTLFVLSPAGELATTDRARAASMELSSAARTVKLAASD